MHVISYSDEPLAAEIWNIFCGVRTNKHQKKNEASEKETICVECGGYIMFVGHSFYLLKNIIMTIRYLDEA